MANLARWITANEVINRAAVECGLNAVSDAYSSQDPSFISFKYLLDSCGQELLQDCDWNIQMRKHEFTTQLGDTGEYDLPDDFSYMIDQTGWQQGVPGGAFPLLGPATPQWWSYLEASQLYSVTIYAWFRIKEAKLNLWPQPPPVGVPIRYEYISRGWVEAGDQADTFRDTAQIPADIILYEPILIVKKLKLAWLNAKGFDSTKAEDEYQIALEAWKGKDKAAPKLDLARTYPGYKMLDGYSNVPETGYGQ